ncbi:uncharacterized protein ZBIST_2722 [Zygosaccharomyces bailii]|nr:uncharacterized protein ZBIST_2722 [Zygosaccharomyces bailii]
MSAARTNGFPAYLYLDTKKNEEESQAKARVSSLSSFFTSNTVEHNGAREIFGFRRFARNYLLASDKSGRFRSSRRENPSVNGYNGNCYAQVNAAPYQIQFQNSNAKNGFGVTIGQEPSTKTHRLNVNGEMIDYELDAYGVPQRIPDLFKEDHINVSLEGENVFVTSSSEDELLEHNVHPKVITLGDVPGNTGIGSILAQVCGGPLENIVVQINEEQALQRVELDFCTFNAARSFMRYGRTNMFKINGSHLKPVWGKTSTGSQRKEWEEPRSDEESSNVCRCLILKKYISSTRRTKYSDVYKESPLEPLNISEIKHDFGNFGQIQEITPVVSRKLCISISFYSVDSAVKVMKEYEDPTTVLHKNYFDSWAIWYGKDITDRPCTVL